MSRGNEVCSKSALHGPYWAALNNDWKSLKDFYTKNVNSLSLPVTASRDNGFHLAVFSKSKDPLQFLLRISEEHPMVKYGYLEKNGYGNTPLHEAAANGNREAVEALVFHHRGSLREILNIHEWKSSKRLLIYQEKGGTTKEEYSRLENIHRQNIRFIEVKPKPKASNEQPGAIQGEMISEPEPEPETALYLLKMDESLAALKNLDGRTSLYLLATMPSAFESGYHWDAWIHRVIYSCLPIGDDADDDEKATTKISKRWLKYLEKICALVRSDTLEEKRKHKLAFKLAETLIKKDSSWDEIINRLVVPEFPFDKDQSSKVDYEPIPLLLATEKGIVEIVNKILEICPQLVEHCNDLGQNILHVAIKHRQYEIFNHVKNMEIPMTRLVRKVDKNGYTILHHAADMKPGTTKRHPEGPVYQLQEEIKWYKRVKGITPAHYAMFRSKDANKTCEELFNSKHNKLLGQAQTWLEGASQSCSAVAVLVATAVFAAAYTVPGGSNEQGYPIFLNSTLFLLFTVMDVIALACSLTSVVMFLSILASPYTYDEFLHKLPRKLAIGFSLLFISLATTMIAFAATLLLIVRLEKPHWATTLIYTAAFLPNWRVTKSPIPKKSASRQGSFADQAAPKQTESHTKQLENKGKLSEESVNDNKPKLPV
ncbi:uncharacterized protein LOC123221473 [Mangifera indica]|uniref:uncharacterized protein LOC123221473 n=1 Tax=Mangifera indica TaxID=29780 RepID=UPI001CF96A37|nr:uncharacterized protein LOC123221473 [Mangifera indica]